VKNKAVTVPVTIQLCLDRRSTTIRLQFDRDVTTVGLSVCGLLHWDLDK